MADNPGVQMCVYVLDSDETINRVSQLTSSVVVEVDHG